MNREQLEHLIRAAAEVTGEYEFVIVGSQSILGPIPDAPADLRMSMEADMYPMNAEEKADRIDGALGEGSRFHDMYGYYAQGVDSKTAVLPQGWRERLQRVQSQLTNGRIGSASTSSTSSWQRPPRTGKRTGSSTWRSCATATYR